MGSGQPAEQLGWGADPRWSRYPGLTQKHTRQPDAIRTPRREPAEHPLAQSWPLRVWPDDRGKLHGLGSARHRQQPVRIEPHIDIDRSHPDVLERPLKHEAGARRAAVRYARHARGSEHGRTPCQRRTGEEYDQGPSPFAHATAAAAMGLASEASAMRSNILHATSNTVLFPRDFFIPSIHPR